MGLAFLGIGLYGILGKSDNDVRSLLWGSLNFCRWRDVRLMLGTTLALLTYIAVFFKELRAVLFSRADAEAAGIRVTPVWTGFLVIAAATDLPSGAVIVLVSSTLLLGAAAIRQFRRQDV